MQFYGGSPGQSQYDSKGFVPVFAPRFTGKVHNLFVMLFFPAIRGQSVTSIGPQVKMRKRFLNQDYWHKSAPIMRIKLAILMHIRAYAPQFSPKPFQRAANSLMPCR